MVIRGNKVPPVLAAMLESIAPGWEQEYRFHPERKWRFDFANPRQIIAIEIDGGTWTAGRHTRGKGYERDCEKLNAATALGWRVFRFTTGMVKSGAMLATIQDVLGVQR